MAEKLPVDADGGRSSGWKQIDTWILGDGKNPIEATVSMIGHGGSFRFRAVWPNGDLEDSNLTQLFQRTALEAGEDGVQAARWRDDIAAFEAFGLVGQWSSPEGTNAAAALKFAYVDVGLTGSMPDLERSLERQTEGKPRRGWVRTEIDGVRISILVFRDASGVAVINREDGAAQILPLIVDLSQPFGTQPGKPCKAAVIMNKAPGPGEADAFMSVGSRKNASRFAMPVDVESLPEPLAAELQCIARQIFSAAELLDSLPSVLMPSEGEVDAGEVLWIDPAGIWQNAEGAIFYWPRSIPHRRVRLDSFEKYREVVAGYTKLMLWADPDIVSPVSVTLNTFSGSPLHDETVDISYDLQCPKKYSYRRSVRAAEDLIRERIPELATSIGFETRVGALSADVMIYPLLELQVCRPSAAEANALEKRFGSPFSDQPGYVTPCRELAKGQMTDDTVAQIDLMTGDVLGAPGTSVHIYHDLLMEIVADDSAVFQTPMWVALSGGVPSVRFEQAVRAWFNDGSVPFFPRPRCLSDGWAMSFLVADEADRRIESPLGMMSVLAEFAPIAPGELSDAASDREAFVLDIEVLSTFLLPRADGTKDDDRVRHGLLSGLLEALRLALFEISDACDIMGGEMDVEAVVRCAVRVEDRGENVDILVRALSEISEELRDWPDGSPRVFLSAGAGAASDAGDPPCNTSCLVEESETPTDQTEEACMERANGGVVKMRHLRVVGGTESDPLPTGR